MVTKSKPILFSGPMVRAILLGKKTQTRRVVKPKFNQLWGQGICKGDDYYSIHVDIKDSSGEWKWIKCPFGKVGDRLWVRETFCQMVDEHRPPDHAYKADCTGDDRCRQDYIRAGYPYQWTPSIHMPRWASRITLEITSVRVERLKDISESDAKAEGAEPYRCPMAESLVNAVGGGMKPIPYTSGFANLWNSINGPESWAANPFVWVIEFRRVE